jgi:hypothetical protein
MKDANEGNKAMTTSSSSGGAVRTSVDRNPRTADPAGTCQPGAVAAAESPELAEDWDDDPLGPGPETALCW